MYYFPCFSDFVFVEGTEVIFKVALCLLGSHEGEIVECDSFESIVDYLKTTLPTLSHTQMEQTIAKVHKQPFLQCQIIKHTVTLGSASWPKSDNSES